MLSKIDQKNWSMRDRLTRLRQKLRKIFSTIRWRKATLSDAGDAALRFYIGGSFAGSKYIADKIAIPADYYKPASGRHSKWKKGRSLLRRFRQQNLFPREAWRTGAVWEALEFLVENYPQKDYILKARATMAAAPVRHSMMLVRKRWTLCFWCTGCCR